jgi:hypothetical protein
MAKESQIRQNYHEDCEALVNKQVNMKLYTSYVYISMVREEQEETVLNSDTHFPVHLLQPRRPGSAWLCCLLQEGFGRGSLPWGQEDEEDTDDTDEDPAGRLDEVPEQTRRPSGAAGHHEAQHHGVGDSSGGHDCGAGDGEEGED